MKRFFAVFFHEIAFKEHIEIKRRFSKENPTRREFDYCNSSYSYCNSYFLVHQAKSRVKSNTDGKITPPNSMKKYNQGTAGADVMDLLLGSYRHIIRGKKWYWPVIMNAINVQSLLHIVYILQLKVNH